MGDDELGKELEKELNDHHLNYQIDKGKRSSRAARRALPRRAALMVAATFLGGFAPPATWANLRSVF